ncbi:MAG: helix-turn-helix domain-containing protein [Opitutaceae bacterium]|nr:helix-turn-helix domain-containing protein [Opitutaceae bacterium]
MIPHESPFPLRLKQARLLAGLSLRELSERIGTVSHVALTKYERGDMKPSSEVLVALCKALGRTPDQMFRPIRASLANVSFRKRKSFSEKQTSMVLERVRSRLEDYLEAEEFVQEQVKPAHKKLSLPANFRPDDLEPVRKLALQLRNDWGLNEEPIPNLVGLLEDRGYRVIQIDLDEKGFDGCEVTEFRALIIGTWPDHSVARMRLTLAHELAHSLLNESVTKLGLSEKETESVMTTFASEFLLPTAALKRYLGTHRTAITMAELQEVKLRFGISISAIVYALRSIGIINASAHRRFYTQIVPAWKKAGQGEPGDDALSKVYREHPARYHRLVRRGISEGLISLSRGAGLLGKPPSELRLETGLIVE